MRRPTKVAGIVAALVFVVAIRAVAVLFELNAFREINPHFAGRCLELRGVTGAEDIEIDHESGVAYVSATDRRAMFSDGQAGGARDGIYRLTLAEVFTGGAAFEYLPQEGLADFHPHGIDVRRSGYGSVRFFVVNHNAAGESVEVLDLGGGRLVHLKTIRDPLFVSPNDVVSVGPDAFYVTNDRDVSYASRSRTFWGQILFIVLPRSLTTVVFSDGGETAVAASDLDGANGIAASADETEIYITEALGKNVRIYDRDSGNALHLRETIALGSSPDNVSVAPDGKLLIAAKPSIFKMLIARSKRPPLPAPSQVIEVTPASRGVSGVSEIYMNGGEEISAITVSAPFVTSRGGDGLMMSNAYREGVLICESDRQ